MYTEADVFDIISRTIKRPFGNIFCNDVKDIIKQEEERNTTQTTSSDNRFLINRMPVS
jgi:hypothetical protein